MPASQTFTFTGTVRSGAVSVALTRGTDAGAGWALVGNPFVASFDLSSLAGTTGVDDAKYVEQSSGPYTGSYRSYVNGVGNKLVALGQGFFTRVSAGSSTATLTMNSSSTVLSDNTKLYRTTADARPQVQLDLTGNGAADTFSTYAEVGATSGFDSKYDAAKLPNPTGLNLASVAASGESLAIDGRGAFTAATVLALNVGVPAAGTYTLMATSLSNLPAGLTAYLTDAQTGQTTQLSPGGSYSFSVTAAQATSLLVGRFSLRFSPQTALATVPVLTAELVSVYPNPAHGSFAVLVPGVAQAASVQVELLNTLGQVVRRQSAALPAAGTTLTVDAAELAAGVYTLRLTAGATTTTKRVVLN
ncbi:T9SS type A sorting domain-containing protein [Hymenobacter sp. BRD67]|uniref:T9SS type A sorting domain-containing protein n=1 Tax=Hymenobacter sp. BRD67 TaxID=2675877 RepID=UPI0015638800|nr:T9SS type A sorting domain-containing protein [Hymenobacter sp. BRD67]QKG54358.1 T9SS type A sorting domain-containing protein [Hymenobacter sp. BRD67]